jgi:hypothetical protein
MGQWCYTYGLKEDPRRIITSVKPDPIKVQVDRDPSVLAATVQLERAQADYEKANQVFLQAHAAGVEASRKRTLAHDVIVDHVPQRIYPKGTPTVFDIKQLDEAEQQALIQRDHAGEQMVKARQQLELVKERARVRLKAAAGAAV